MCISRKHKLYVFLILFMFCLLIIICMAAWAPVLLFVCLMIIGIISCLLYLGICHCKYDKGNVANVIPPKQKLLVIVPHPDDELNIAGVLIRNVLLRQGEVYIIYTTNFDAYGKNEAHRRLGEIKKLCSKLTVPDRNVFYMGYQASLHQDEKVKGDIEYSYALDGEKTCAVNLYGKEVLQTLDNLESMLYRMIIRIKPDIICGIDYDSHADHRIASDAFENAIIRLTQEAISFKPFVLKGFSYATAWMSVPDFYENEKYLSSTVINDNNSSYTSQYDWENRVRIPYIDSSDLGHTLRSSFLYKMYSAYMSQNALSHMNQIVNGDQVFWKFNSGNASTFSEVENKINYYKIAAYPDKDFLYEFFCKPDKSYQICILNEKNVIQDDSTVKCFFIHDGKEEEISSRHGIYTFILPGRKGTIVCKKEQEMVDSITIHSNRSVKFLMSFILRKSELVLDRYLKRYRTYLYIYKIKKLVKNKK